MTLFTFATKFLALSAIVVSNAEARRSSSKSIEPENYIPADHWNYSTHLTQDNFDSFITEQIAAGKTVFVRWTAGLHCGSCAKQAQAWDDVLRLFGGRDKIVFGDVNIKEPGMTTLKGPPHNPGSDGWPTIRYFNANTGKAGGDYTRKMPKMRKWQELGPDYMHLIQFVEDMSGTFLCDVKTGAGCDAKSLEYLNEMKKENNMECRIALEDVHVRESDLRRSGSKRDVFLVQQKYILSQLVEDQVFSLN